MTKRLQGLQLLRAIAAVSVVLFHITATYHLLVPSHRPFNEIFLDGARGVDLFFVLSGFIIALIHGEDIGKPEALPRFAFYRISRIYPAVFIVTLCSLFVYMHGFGGAEKATKLTISNIVTSFLLLPQVSSPLVNVTWTLKYEMAFYLLFGLAIWRRSLGVTALIAWQVGVLWTCCTQHFAPETLTNFYFQPLCLDFAFGLASAAIFARLRGSESRALHLATGTLAVVSVAAIAFLAEAPQLALFNFDVFPSTVAYGLACAVLITSLSLVEQWGYLKVPTALVFLGDASFSIYLVHFSVLMILQKFSSRHAGHVGIVEMLIVGGVAIAAGIVFHLGIDSVINRTLHQWWKSRRQAQPTVERHA